MLEDEALEILGTLSHDEIRDMDYLRSQHKHTKTSAYRFMISLKEPKLLELRLILPHPELFLLTDLGKEVGQHARIHMKLTLRIYMGRRK